MSLSKRCSAVGVGAKSDVLPVAQFEQLWGDMTALPECHTSYLGVSRQRGQQLKDVGQLPAWHLDGSFDHIAALAGLNDS